MIEFEISRKAKINEDRIFDCIVDRIFDEKIEVETKSGDSLRYVYNLPVNVQKTLFNFIGKKLIEYANDDSHFEEFH